jgi:Tol biopolymer transport system component
LPGRETATLVASFASDDGSFGPIHFTRDSAYVAVAYDGMDPTRIYVGKTDGSQLTRLENVDNNYDATIGWSPDGRRLAFIAKTPDGPTLATVAPDGSGRKLLAPLPASAGDEERWVQAALSWSYNGESIAISFSEGRTEPNLITTMIVDAANGKAVTLEGASSATYSPTEGLLAYLRADAGEKCSVVLRDARGSTEVLRTMADCAAVQVYDGIHWAPNGSRLAYGEYRGIDQTPAWHVIAKDGSGDLKLTDGLWNSTVAWSPDSTRVVIGDAETIGLTVYNAATGSDNQIVDLYHYPSGLAWASNNEVIYTQGGYVNVFRTDDSAWAGGGEFSESDAKYAVTPDGKHGVYVRSNIFDTQKATVELIKQ